MTNHWTRRGFVGAAAAGVVTGHLRPTSLSASDEAGPQAVSPLRWGIVGTGTIANSMAGMIELADNCDLTAVSSRRMDSARQFAERHDVGNAFDSWADMAASDTVDAIYVATPTSVREEICLAAATNGKHVLGEKPFASLPSVRRIVAACHEHDVAFMDGTHFVHHPRTHDIQARQEELVGTTWSVASAFQFNLRNRDNIRYNTELEPMGAIGDAGWYNMRATVEYLPASTDLEGVGAFLRRDQQTGAVAAASGVLQFLGGATATWHCGFDAAPGVMELRIAGDAGVINVESFIRQKRDNSADFTIRRGGRQGGTETITIPSDKPGAALMFEDMAAAAANPELRSQWMTATERTQALLDAVWAAALDNEGNA